jgi:DNA-directed RNA polymerase specialized sigma24 family protein
MTAAPRPDASRGDRDTARAAAEAEIERDYALLEAEILQTVRGKLAAHGAPIDDHALDASYNQAWHALYAARVSGEEIENRAGFLVQVTYRRALDERRASRHDGVADSADEAVDPDLAGQLDDSLRVRALMQGMRERLDDRELHAAALCYVHGYTRPEAARALGVRPRRFEKVMDQVSRQLSDLVGDLRAGEWCDSRRSLIGAYALGVLDADGERYQLATAHLEDCSACRRRVLCMRGLAGIAPPAPLLLAALPGAGGAGAGIAERWTWLGRANQHWAEIGAGGAVVAVAASAVLVLGPQDDQATPPPAAPAAAVPSPEGSSTKLRATAARTVDRARAAVLARTADKKPAQPAPASAAPPPAAPVAPSDPAPVEAPPPPVAEQQSPAAAPPADAAPADDGWEEFELRR